MVTQRTLTPSFGGSSPSTSATLAGQVSADASPVCSLLGADWSATREIPCFRSSMAEPPSRKRQTRVRFSSEAPLKSNIGR